MLILQLIPTKYQLILKNVWNIWMRSDKSTKRDQHIPSKNVNKHIKLFLIWCSPRRFTKMFAFRFPLPTINVHILWHCLYFWQFLLTSAVANYIFATKHLSTNRNIFKNGSKGSQVLCMKTVISIRFDIILTFFHVQISITK